MTDFSYRQYFIESLGRAIEAAESERAKMIENINSMGAAYAVRWATEALRMEQRAKVAKDILDRLGAGDMLAEIADDLASRHIQETGWLIPSNSDSNVDVFRLQALADFASEARSALKHEAKAEAKAAEKETA